MIMRYGPVGPWFGWASFIFSDLLWLLLLGLIVWGVLSLARGSTRMTTPMQANMPPQPVSAMEVLRMRYARGEIDAATFEEMRQRLQRPDQEPPTAV